MKWKLGGRRAASPPASESVTALAPPPMNDSDVERYAFSDAVVMLQPRASRAAKAVRDTAGELFERHIAQGRRAVVVCGAKPGIGVSFMSVNLAVALSQLGVSTLLIDARLQAPKLESFIAPSRPPEGVQQFLRSEDVTVGDIVHNEVLPGLSLIYAGGACDDAADLIATDRLADLLGACMRDYTFTIIDTPAPSRSAMARRVASLAGYTLIVARAGDSHFDSVKTLSRNMADDGIEVVGSVLIDG